MEDRMTIDASEVGTLEEVLGPHDPLLATCNVCGGTGECPECFGHDEECEVCDGTGECPECGGEGASRVPDNGPPGIEGLVNHAQGACPAFHLAAHVVATCHTCKAIELAVEMGWRGALARLRYLKSVGVTIDLLDDVEPSGNMRGGIGG